MRYIPIACLKNGMTVARTLYDYDSNILLQKGHELRESYIKRLRQLGYQGLYIEDEISADLVIKDIISDEIRKSAVDAVKDLLVYANTENREKHESIDDKIMSVNKVILSIIDTILQNDDNMVNLINLKTFDEYTFYHSVNVSVLSLLIGYELGLDKNDLFDLGLGAMLHDVGKMFVGKELINKKKTLLEEEMALIRKHTIYGHRYLKQICKLNNRISACALQHHERYDGEGYPNGLEAKDIGLFGRIITVCDVYDALTANRAYRDALPPAEAIEYIMGNMNKHFDADIVKIFIKKIAAYPLGSTVSLSNGLTGIVVENYQEFSLRPKLKIYKDQNGIDIECYYIDLRDDINTNITIESVVKSF